jgi:hypothetical protein
VFNIRENKLAKKFVEGDLDDQSCPGAHAFREALHDAIIWISERQEKKWTCSCRDPGCSWKQIGVLRLNFTDGFKKAFIPHPEPRIDNPNSLAKKIADLINTKQLDETIKIEQGEESPIDQELSHLAGHVFVKQDANIVFSHKFLKGDRLADNIKYLRNALCEVLKVNSCQELTYKLIYYTFNITDFETCKESVLDGFSELQVTDEEVEEFLDHLMFAVKQPNEDRLSEKISDKLGQELNITDGDLITSDLITSYFQNRMINWLKQKQGSYQSNNTVGTFFSDFREKVRHLST